MKDNEDKKWNFVWQKDGSLTISGSDDIILYTFDKESGKWGVGISEAESAAIALFDKYGVAPDTYILTDVDGIMVGTDKETGVEIFRDGRFDISYAVKLAKRIVNLLILNQINGDLCRVRIRNLLVYI